MIYEIWADLVPRFIGTVGGVLIAFAMSNDARTWKGLIRRLIVAAVFGILLPDPVAERLGVLYQTPRQVVAASCISAAVGWWLMHALIRLFQLWPVRWQPPAYRDDTGDSDPKTTRQ